MTGIASRGQLRMSFARTALVIVPLILLLGYVSGWVSGSSADNAWYDALVKPSWTPPGGAFALAWTLLYILMGTALAMIVYARGAAGRQRAILAFGGQLALNLAWSPTFFAAHQTRAALFLIAAIFGLALATTFLFYRIRKAAGVLMMPYLAWLAFAAVLNYQIIVLNPDAETLAPGASSTEMTI